MCVLDSPFRLDRSAGSSFSKIPHWDGQDWVHLSPSDWGYSINTFFFFFCLFSAAPTAYGRSQARGWIETVDAGYTTAIAMPDASHIHYTADCGNARSLTHWVRPGIEAAYSWIQVRFLTCWATKGTPINTYFKVRSTIPERCAGMSRSALISQTYLCVCAPPKHTNIIAQ